MVLQRNSGEREKEEERNSRVVPIKLCFQFWSSLKLHVW